MGLLDALLQEPAKTNVYIAVRGDNLRGVGTAQDPFNGMTRQGPPILVVLGKGASPPFDREATVNTGSVRHGFANGDVVMITGVTGDDAELWNGQFGIYGVEEFSFKYYMKKPPAPAEGSPTCVHLSFPFDEVMRELPANTRINLGPGTFQTRGFAPNDSRGWQPKSRQKIVGAGMDATTLQLVGAENADQHYHVIGMPIEPSGTSPITPLEHFEVSDLAIDCNVDNQPGRPDPGYANVACGAVRILGSYCRVRRVKAIHWGTKSLKQGCFVISIIDASGRPSDANGQPILTETLENGIEECVAVQPSKNNARECTILHIGGLKNTSNHAQGFSHGPFIRKNFVDCTFLTSEASPKPFSSAFITSKSGTQIVGNVGTFVGKRLHFRKPPDIATYIRLYNVRDPSSRWNGYFPITAVAPDDTLTVGLGASQGMTNDSSLVLLGTEFRGIVVSSCRSAVVEHNQIHNCWIGGPYQSPLDDSVSQPTTPPTLQREERLDPLDALNTRSLTVRGNIYRNVAVGPYWNMGGLSGAVPGNSVAYNAETGVATVTAEYAHKLWVGARVKIEAASDPRLDGLHEITEVYDSPFSFASYFRYRLAPGLENLYTATANYRVVSGVDFLVIEDNQIELADLEEAEFAIKEYPLAGSPGTRLYRAYGIVVADNGLSTLAGPHAHRQVLIGRNRIGYVNNQTVAVVAGLGPPAGGAMMLAGVKELQVTHNVLELNAPKPLRTFRCGAVRFFNNKTPDGKIRPGWKWDTNAHYDEPETLAEDAFILSLLQRRRR